MDFQIGEVKDNLLISEYMFQKQKSSEKKKKQKEKSVWNCLYQETDYSLEFFMQFLMIKPVTLDV